jgi:hypothetical protein
VVLVGFQHVLNVLDGALPVGVAKVFHTADELFNLVHAGVIGPSMAELRLVFDGPALEGE